MQVLNACFKEFPDQCAGCPEYSETIHDPSTQIMWLLGTGMLYHPPYGKQVIKECKRYHKRKIEYLR